LVTAAVEAITLTTNSSTVTRHGTITGQTEQIVVSADPAGIAKTRSDRDVYIW
jgi:hypothetical protein